MGQLCFIFWNFLSWVAFYLSTMALSYLQAVGEVASGVCVVFICKYRVGELGFCFVVVYFRFWLLQGTVNLGVFLLF